MKLFASRFPASALLLALSLSASLLLSGCSNDFNPSQNSVAPQTSIGKMSGRVFGGQQAVVGASVYLYQTGTTGYGSASTSILTSQPSGGPGGGYPTYADSNSHYYVVTDSVGGFNLAGDYTCTSGTEVYAYAVGGNPGAGANTAAGFLAALGQCPSSGNLASTVPFINISEASTIAAAYALAPFAVDALHIGIPTNANSTLAALEQTNLNNAFLTAANIFPMSTPTPTSTFPTYTSGTGTQTPSNTITAYSISGGIATFTSNNTYTAGTSLLLSGFPTSTFLNGQSITVLSTGLSSTQFEAAVTGSTASITKYANSTTVATFTSANTFFTGEQVTLSGFPSTAPNSTVPYNGVTVTIISTGLGTTKFEANYPVAATVGTTTLSTAALATMSSNTITESGTATLPAGTLPTSKLNTLADILAACVNSNPTTGTQCSTLLSTALSAGTTGNAPTDTATAAIYMAQYPGVNMSTLFGLIAGTGAPFQPILGAYPSDFTISIIYSGGGLSTNGTSCCSLASHNVGIDSSGNVWTTSTAAPFVLSGFTNQGVPLSGTPFTYSVLAYPSGAVIDAASQNVFIADEINAADTAYATTLNEYNIASNSWATITAVNGVTNEIDDAIDLTFDGAGNLWVANTQAPDNIVKLTPSSSAPYTYSYAAAAANTTYVTTPYALAAEPGPSGGIWVAGAAGSTTKYADLFTNADAYSLNSTTDYEYAYSVAIDASGSAWVANEEIGVSKIPAAGGTGSNFAYPSEYATVETLDIALDGAGNAWIPDIDNGLILEYNNSGTLISGTKGYLPNEGSLTPWIPPAKSTTGFVVPAYLAVDGSGNVWIKPYGSKTLQEMVGVAVPVVTPTAYGTANSLLATEP